MAQQFHDLKVPFSIHYLKASVPDDSQAYLPPNIPLKSQKVYCSARSHHRAIHYASLEESADFSIIIEDDVAFHTKDFVPVVQELAQNWNKVRSREANAVFLGWMPMKNVSEYTHIEKKLSLQSSPDLEFIHMIPVGVQAYMIEKQCAKLLSPLLNQRTHEAVVKSIKAQKFKNITEDNTFYVADHYVPHILTPFVTFPPLGIELPLPSTIGHNDQKEYWDTFFKGYESKKKKYWFYDSATD